MSVLLWVGQVFGLLICIAVAVVVYVILLPLLLYTREGLVCLAWMSFLFVILCVKFSAGIASVQFLLECTCSGKFDKSQQQKLYNECW